MHVDILKNLNPNERLTKLYVEHNTANKTFDELFETMKFDTFHTAEDAVRNGFADKVVSKKSNISDDDKPFC